VKRTSLSLLMLSVFGLSTPVLAINNQPNLRSEGYLNGQFEVLNNNYLPWREEAVGVKQNITPLFGFGAQLRDVSRFGLSDQDGMLSTFFPIVDGANANFDFSFSPTANVIPRMAYGGELGLKVWNNLSFYTGLRRMQFTSANVNRLALTLENYWWPLRVAVTQNFTQVEPNLFPISQQGALSYFYGADELSSINLIAAIGQEMQALDNNRVLVMDIRNITLGANHFIGSNFALTPEVSYAVQGTLFNRLGARVGVRYVF
jgi:YaiO family outer membrane protein